MKVLDSIRHVTVNELDDMVKTIAYVNAVTFKS